MGAGSTEGMVPVLDAGDGFVAIMLASWHPQVACWWYMGCSAPEYSGKLVLACVARQLSTVNGESMLISKCRLRLPAGSSGSSREIRMTIYQMKN